RRRPRRAARDRRPAARHRLGAGRGRGVPPRVQLPPGPRRGQGHRRVRPPAVVRGARAVLRAIRDKAEAGRRVDRAEGRWLLTEAPLLELGSVAQESRLRRIPERRVTFVIDSNPNYTNVCITDCQFCAFYRKPGDPNAWTLTVEEVLAKVESAA